MKKIHFILTLLCCTMMCMLNACDDDTAYIGFDVMPDSDNVSVSKAIYTFNSRSIKVDSVLANTNSCYLGNVMDPETRSNTTAGFLAQFHMMENFKFPAKELMMTNPNNPNEVMADSCYIRLFFDNYYGDSLATMKLFVHELDKNRVLKENIHYYSNLKAANYIDANSYANTTMAYAIKDYTRPDSVTDGSDYLRSIIVKLPKEYGSYLLNSYYQNPDNFKNSYNFIHNVCAGFNFQTIGSIGSMINIKVAALDVYFKYLGKNELGNDTIIEGMHRMAATEEVIQNTHVTNTLPDDMLCSDNGYTYIKSPSGIFTELDLPVSDVVAGSHYSDTINSAQITLRRYHNSVESDYHLPAPTTILMLRKADARNFFERGALPDGKTSYISTFDTHYNAYQFSNIGQLITTLKIERDKGAGVHTTMSEAERNARYAAWENEHLDWNKVILIPINAEYTTTTNIYGTPSQTLLRVRHLFALSSARLEGGENGNLEMTVVYSSFSEK